MNHKKLLKLHAKICTERHDLHGNYVLLVNPKGIQCPVEATREDVEWFIKEVLTSKINSEALYEVVLGTRQSYRGWKLYQPE